MVIDAFCYRKGFLSSTSGSFLALQYVNSYPVQHIFSPTFNVWFDGDQPISYISITCSVGDSWRCFCSLIAQPLCVTKTYDVSPLDITILYKFIISFQHFFFSFLNNNINLYTTQASSIFPNNNNLFFNKKRQSFYLIYFVVLRDL